MTRKEELLNQIIDAPETLSQVDVQEIFADAELRELYDNAVLLGKCGLSVPEIDTEAELEKIHGKMLEEGLIPKKKKIVFEENIGKNPTLFERFRRVAAVIGIVFGLSIVAVASVIVFRNIDYSPEKKEVVKEETVTKKSSTKSTAPADTDDTKDLPDEFLFDNVEMQEIAAVLGKYYHVTPVFENEDAKHVRLYLQIEKGKSIEEVVALMNNFKKVQLSLVDGKLIIR